MILAKIIAIVLVVVLLAVALVGCTKIEKESTDSDTSMFVCVEETASFSVVYHKDTKVMYAVSVGYNSAGNFTLLVNADGSPMLWGVDTE